MARAKAFWKKSYDDAAVALPLSAAATKSFPAPPGTGAVYAPVALSDDWSKLGLCDVRRDRLLFAAHTCAAVLHAIFMITALVITLQSDSPYLQTWRQQFLFVRNTTTCGRNSLFNETGEDEVVAVLIPAGRIHVGLASAAFFMLSCLFSCIWVLASTYDPLGRVLLGWLADAYAPLRWCVPDRSCLHKRVARPRRLPCLLLRRLEYSASASLQVTVLLLISGGRSQVEIACVFVLMAVTMACGYLTEVCMRFTLCVMGGLSRGPLPPPRLGDLAPRPELRWCSVEGRPARREQQVSQLRLAHASTRPRIHTVLYGVERALLPVPKHIGRHRVGIRRPGGRRSAGASLFARRVACHSALTLDASQRRRTFTRHCSRPSSCSVPLRSARHRFLRTGTGARVHLAHYASCRCTDYLSVASAFQVPRDGAGVRAPLLLLKGVHTCYA